MHTRPVNGEADGLLAFLAHQREAVRIACFGLTDEQARLTPIPSALSAGGLVKHLAYGERGWAGRLKERTLEGDADQETALTEYFGSFRLEDDESLSDTLADYAAAAVETDRIAASIEDLGRLVPLPAAPWFPAEGCTVRWVLLHLIEETARHAGHVDLMGGGRRRTERAPDGRGGRLARGRLGDALEQVELSARSGADARGH
jgi:uncharacterized damage-inducible protein DinB